MVIELEERTDAEELTREVELLDRRRRRPGGDSMLVCRDDVVEIADLGLDLVRAI